MRSVRYTILLVLFLWSIHHGDVHAQDMVNPVMVGKVYESQPAWLSDPVAGSAMQQAFVHILDSATYKGLNKEKYHYHSLLQGAVDGRVLADAIISYAKDLYSGAEIARWIINDEVSPKYAAAYDDVIIARLGAIHQPGELQAVFASLEPLDREYISLKDALKRHIDSAQTSIATQLAVCLNLYRWVHHFRFSRFIVVNIPSATLRYYEADNTKLEMKVVVGKPTTRTPRFSAYCKEIILYPYWHVPGSIAVKELLPKIKRNPSVIDRERLQVMTKGGKVLNHYSIEWSQYNASNFPYILRQYTGCDNALGVIKFNLTDPFDVYMHDTNFKEAFLKKSRFLSHGCIRLEKPVELGNLLLDGNLDAGFLEACVKGQKPVLNKLKEAVPVFVVYMPATVDSDNNIVLHNDIYRLFK